MMKRYAMMLMAGMVTCLITSQATRADYLAEFSGNTRFGPASGDVAGAVVSFTVWECEDGMWFDDLASGSLRGQVGPDGTVYGATFHDDGFRDIERHNLLATGGNAQPVLNDEGNPYPNERLIGVNPDHRYIYMYQVVRGDTTVPVTALRFPHAYGVGADGLPSVGSVKKWLAGGGSRGNSVFKFTPWRSTRLPNGERQTTYGSDSARVGWPSGRGTAALGLQLTMRDDGMLWIEAPSDVPDVVDGVPSHAGTVPMNYSGHGKVRGEDQPHYPTILTRDAEANTLQIEFDPLTESHRSDHATTSVIFVTSDTPPSYRGVTLLGTDGAEVTGDLPVPTE